MLVKLPNGDWLQADFVKAIGATNTGIAITLQNSKHDGVHIPCDEPQATADALADAINDALRGS